MSRCRSSERKLARLTLWLSTTCMTPCDGLTPLDWEHIMRGFRVPA